MGRVVEIDPNAADVIRQYWCTLEQSDWDAALAMCTEDVRKEAKKYSSAGSFFQAVVPIKEILKKADPPRTGDWVLPPKYFAYIFDVRISQPNLSRDASWVWKVRRLEGRKEWEINFPVIPFDSWLANEEEAAKHAAMERQRLINEFAPRLKGVRTILTAERKEFTTGEPIYLRLHLVNQGDSVVNYQDSQVAVNNSMTITGPDGKEVEYTASMVQTLIAPKIIKPGQTKKLFDRFDVTEQYALDQPGQYRVQFSGRGLWFVLVPEEDANANDPGSLAYPNKLPSNVLTITLHGAGKKPSQ